jgi:hypothetical protein
MAPSQESKKMIVDDTTTACTASSADTDDELEELIEAGDWTGVVQAAKEKTANNEQQKNNEIIDLKKELKQCKKTAEQQNNEISEDSQDPTVEPIASTTGLENAAAAAADAVATTVLTTVIGSMNAAAAVAAVAVATTVDERCGCCCCCICCRIISDRYSRHEKLQTLKYVYKWAHNGVDFLKLFHACGGISSLLNFLIKTMYDGNCVGANRMECIEYVALIIGDATSLEENNVNEDIAKKVVTSIMECDGINPLIAAASEEYSGGDDVPQLNALDSVWYALRNISSEMDEMKDLINKDQAIALFDTGINTISHLKSVDYPEASSTVEHIFVTLSSVVFCNYVTKKYLQDNDILSKCLVVFKKDDVWTCQDEELLQSATRFFVLCCFKNLLDKSSDYEMLLPLLVMVSNSGIRHDAMYMLDGAEIVERSTVEVLESLLNMEDVNEDTKKMVRYLIHEITSS